MENLHEKLGKLWEEHDFAQTSTIEYSEVDCLIEGVIEEEGHAYWHEKGDYPPGSHEQPRFSSYFPPVLLFELARGLATSRRGVGVPPPCKESQKKAMSALIQACRHNKDEILQVLDQVDRKGTTRAYASQVKLLKLSEDVGVTLHLDLAQKALVMPEGVSVGMPETNVET